MDCIFKGLQLIRQLLCITRFSRGEGQIESAVKYWNGAIK